jgi:uncharacterized membrane-anchored protein YjiN (DUF445 family)
MILLRKNKDWKSLLTEDSKILLSEIFEATKRHRTAYSSTEDVKFAQLWCALIELKREMKKLNEKVEKLEKLLEPILNVSVEEKKKTIEALIKEILPEKGEKEKEKIIAELEKL